MKSRIFLSFYSYNSERSSLRIRPPFIAHHSRTRLLGKRNSTTCNLVHWPEWQRANSLLGRWRHIWNRRGRLVTRLNNVMKDMNHLPSKLRTGKFCPGIAFTICTKTNRITFSGVPMLPEIFRWTDPKSRVLFTFQTDSPETFHR